MNNKIISVTARSTVPQFENRCTRLALFKRPSTNSEEQSNCLLQASFLSSETRV